MQLLRCQYLQPLFLGVHNCSKVCKKRNGKTAYYSAALSGEADNVKLLCGSRAGSYTADVIALTCVDQSGEDAERDGGLLNVSFDKRL